MATKEEREAEARAAATREERAATARTEREERERRERDERRERKRGRRRELPTREVPAHQHPLEGTPPINERDERARLAAAPKHPRLGTPSAPTPTVDERARARRQAAKREPPELVTVVATRMGYAGHIRRNVGDVFDLELRTLNGKKEELPRWVREATEEDTGEQGSRERTPVAEKTRVLSDVVI